MERVMTVEEKIRRAEEIYEKRRQGEVRPVAKVTVNHKKDVKLLKKMLIQILICVVIYLIFYMVQKHEYVFSEDFMNKANEILSYDTNFMALYNMVKEPIVNLTRQQEAKPEETKPEETQSEPETNESSNQEAIGGAEQNAGENTQNLSQEEIDIQNIKATTTFIKPIEGTISSPYGQRDNATGRVPKNHTGIDIATDMGTKIVAATEGEVVLSSEEGDYRKAFKNSNWRS